jgi:hypothetical protein
MSGPGAGGGVLAVAAWQAVMIRGPGLWALARRRADGGRDVLCGGAAAACAGWEATRAPGWTAALRAGADEFLFLPGPPSAILGGASVDRAA